MRERARVFGEVAGDYADVRAGYADELVTAVFDYLGRVSERVVEPGAGTGKATEAFAARGVPVTCVEPDPAMARVLRGRLPGVEGGGVPVRGLGAAGWRGTAADLRAGVALAGRVDPVGAGHAAAQHVLAAPAAGRGPSGPAVRGDRRGGRRAWRRGRCSAAHRARVGSPPTLTGVS